MSVAARDSLWCTAYQFELALPVFLYAEEKGVFKTGGRFTEGEECLMWSFRFTILGSCKDNSQSVDSAQR